MIKHYIIVQRVRLTGQVVQTYEVDGLKAVASKLKFLLGSIDADKFTFTIREGT